MREQHYFPVRSFVHPYIRPSRFLLLIHWAEFNQTCYITSLHGKCVQEQHYFFMRPSFCVSELDRLVFLLLLLYLYSINGAGQVRASAFSPEKRKIIKCHDTFNLVILILISHAKRAESLIIFWTEVKLLKLLSSGRSSFRLSKVLMFRGWNCLVLLNKTVL